MSPMCQQKLRREPVPGIPQQDTHKDLPTAWPTTAPQKAATAWEGPQKEAETIRRCLHLSPYPKAAAASPRAPSGPGWWLLGGQELVRRPGRARDVGWHQPPQCPLRNWWAQPERSGMSQLPCQGQQEMTSAAPGWCRHWPCQRFPRPPGSRAPLWSFPCLDTPQRGTSGRGFRAPPPQPCHSWQRPIGPWYVEQKSAARSSGPE